MGGDVDNPKILVVDDEPDVVMLIATTLRGEGFDVIPAYDGLEALDKAALEKPDLIILDIMMPMMSGYEVCQQLKSDPASQHIPVVCLSSAHTPDARAQSLHVGAVTLLTKPFLPNELVAQIKRHLPTQANQ
jgi:CheY-like chemotaxis protein